MRRSTPPKVERARCGLAAEGTAAASPGGAAQWNVTSADAVECGPLLDGTKPTRTRVRNGRWLCRPPDESGTLSTVEAALLRRRETRLRLVPPALRRPAS